MAARGEMLKLRVSADDLDVLDAARGELPRSEFVRRAIVAATQRLAVEPVAEQAPERVPERPEPAPAPAPVPVRGQRQRLALGAHPFAPVEPWSLMCRCGYAARYH